MLGRRARREEVRGGKSGRAYAFLVSVLGASYRRPVPICMRLRLGVIMHA